MQRTLLWDQHQGRRFLGYQGVKRQTSPGAANLDDKTIDQDSMTPRCESAHEWRMATARRTGDGATAAVKHARSPWPRAVQAASLGKVPNHTVRGHGGPRRRTGHGRLDGIRVRSPPVNCQASRAPWPEGYVSPCTIAAPSPTPERLSSLANAPSDAIQRPPWSGFPVSRPSTLEFSGDQNHDISAKGRSDRAMNP